MIKNKIELEGDVAKITVVQRNGRKHEFLIHATDLAKLEDWDSIWALKHKTGKFYAVLYKYDKGISTQCYLHRIIMDASDGIFVDHINRNTFDNRKENLRLATKQQNGENLTGANRDSKSGIRGVSWNLQNKKWLAQVKVKGCAYYLGLYEDIKEAETVVVTFRRKHMPFSEMDKEEKAA